jgi:hypothetical protein
MEPIWKTERDVDVVSPTATAPVTPARRGQPEELNVG